MTIFAHRRCSSKMLVKSIAREGLGEDWPLEGEWWMSASVMSGTVDDMAYEVVDRSAHGVRVAALASAVSLVVNFRIAPRRVASDPPRRRKR